MNDQRLSDELHHRADGLTDLHPLGLDDVKHRARGIRRRRRTVSGLAIAAVLAVAVPVGVSLDGPPTTTRPEPPVATQGPDGQGEPDRRGVLTNDVDATSGAPGVPYLLDGAAVVPGAEPVPLDGPGRFFAPLGEGWVTADPASGELRFFDAEGALERTEESTGQLAGSADGSIVAWTTPEGRVLTASTEGGDRELVGPEGGEASPVRVAAVLGSGSCDAECTVYVQVDGEQPEVYATTGEATSPTRVAGLLTVADVRSDGTLTGTVSRADDGTCSALSVGGVERWRTCDHLLDRVSPDGRHVIGRPAYADGLGDPSLAILDAADGSVVAEWSTGEQSQAYVNTAVWDADGTVLATVYERGSWALMRMSPDGGLTTVLELEGGDESTPPLVLPVAP